MRLEKINSPVRKTFTDVSVKGLSDRLNNGELIVILAPFGSGKSLTTREVFFDLRKHVLSGAHSFGALVPVAINLREHWNEPFGDELLERHARSIAYLPKEDLTGAWRASLIALLIDGFDELTSQISATQDNKSFMRDARHKALTGVRDLISRTPKGVGILLCGRDQYFDNHKEREHALGLSGREYSVVRLGEFDEERAQRYLKRKGIDTPLPDWMPRKPLLLGYLAQKGLLREVVSIDASLGYGFVWDKFLELICQREAMDGHASMDPDTTRRIMERLAAFARETPQGTGPISGGDLANAYRQEVGHSPADAVLMQLQRLPGLAQREDDDSLRSFIDQEMLSALQGGAAVRMLFGQDIVNDTRPWIHALNDKAVDVAIHRLTGIEGSLKTIQSVLFREIRKGSDANRKLLSDCLSILLHISVDEGTFDLEGQTLSGLNLDHLDLEEVRISNAVFEGCTFNKVTITAEAIPRVRFQDCFISTLVGASSRSALSQGMFDTETQIDVYDELNTSTAILKSTSLAEGEKALLICLKKLYRQSGSGRRLSAFRRGSDSIKPYIDGTLALLRTNGLIVMNSEIVNPIRKQQARVNRILDEGALSGDPLLVEAKHIKRH